MPFSVSPQPDTIANKLIEFSATNAAELVTSGSNVFYMIDIDNTVNKEDVHLKLWNTTSSVTVGTTVPNMEVKCTGAVREVISFPAGITFGTGMTLAMTTEGGTAGVTNPTNAVPVKLLLA